VDYRSKNLTQNGEFKPPQGKSHFRSVYVLRSDLSNFFESKTLQGMFVYKMEHDVLVWLAEGMGVIDESGGVWEAPEGTTSYAKGDNIEGCLRGDQCERHPCRRRAKVCVVGVDV